MNPPSTIAPPGRILVRGVNWLGDAVMTTPALLRLREAHPEAHIALLTHEKLAGLWQQHPAVDSVLTFANGENVWSVAGRLRAEQFQTALILPNSTRSALEAWLARIQHRVGYDGAGRNWLLTQPIQPRPEARPMRKRSVAEIKQLIQSPPPAAAAAIPASAHHLHHYLHLASALGASAKPLPPLIHVTDAEVAEVRQRFGLAENSRPWFGLNAGAEYGPAKRWPRERFVAASLELQARTDCRWIIFGGKADTDLAADITAQIQSAAGRAPIAPALVLNLAGQTSLRELCAALKACRVLLTNDTGPMHLAAAVGTPVVALFGSTSPELTGPGLPSDARHQLLKSDVPCAPCFLRECPIDFRCMHGLSVDQVVAAVLRAGSEVQPS